MRREETKEKRENEKPRNANASVTRRQALSKMATAAIGAGAVIVVGGVAYYLSSMPPAPPTSTMTTEVATSSMATSAASTEATGIVPGGKSMKFNIWGFHPEIVQENMGIFNQQYSENGEVTIGPGDYYGNLETRLISGASSGIDMFYCQSDWMTKWYKAGWIQPVNEEDHFNDIRNDYGNKNLLDVLTMPDGKQAGWIYWNGCVPLLYDGKVLKDAGLADDTGHIKSAPKTWDEVIQICRDIKKSGAAKYPYFPKWDNCTTCGIDESFDIYCISEGELQFDKATQEPTFENDTVMHILDNMRTLIAEELAPASVLTGGEQDTITGFATGKYAFSEQHDYNLAEMNNPDRSPHSGYFHWMPRQPGKTGDYMYFGAIYSITNHEYMKRSPNDAKRVERLHQFYAWKDKTGDYLAGRKWIQNSPFLGQPYTAFYDDPVTKANWLKSGVYDEQDFELRKKANLSAVIPPGYVGMIFYSDWHAVLNDVLPKMVLGQVSTKDAMKTMVDAANNLRQEYGGPEIWK